MSEYIAKVGELLRGMERKKRGKMLVTYVIDMAEKEREVGEVEGRSALPA